MISNSSILLLPKIIRQSFIFGGCPYKWDKEKRKIRITRNIYSLTRWQISVFLYLVYPFYLFCHCCYSYLAKRPLMESNLCFYMLVATMIIGTMNLMVARKTVEMATLLNSAQRYQRRFLRRYVDPYVRDKMSKKSSGTIESLPWKFFHMVHVFVFPVFLLFCFHPYHAIFPTSIMPDEMRNIVSLTIFAGGLIYGAYGALSLLSLIGAVFIYSLLIVRETDSQLHFSSSQKKFKFWTLPRLRTISNIILNHRSQALLNRMFDDIFATFAMPYITIVTRAVIFSAFMLFKFNTKMNIMMTFFTAISLILIPFAGFSILYFSASVYQTSEYVQSTWYRHDWRKFMRNSTECKLFVRFRKSCRYFGVQVGTFYKIKMHTAITIIHMIMSEVAGLLLTVDGGSNLVVSL